MHAIPGIQLRPFIGGGAGGDFIGAGAAQEAMNVVCVEKDKRQFLALLKTLIQFADSQLEAPAMQRTHSPQSRSPATCAPLQIRSSPKMFIPANQTTKMTLNFLGCNHPGR